MTEGGTSSRILRRSDIREQEGVVQGRYWGRSDIRTQKEGVVQGRDWGQVTLENRKRE